jgi:hypothetical protein
MFTHIASLSLGFLLLAAQALSSAEKRHAHSHVHGTAAVNIVVEGKSVIVEFSSPAEDIMGFEHEAKSEADKKKHDAVIKVLKERFAEMVILEKSLDCVPQPAEVAVVRTDAAGKDARGADKKGGEHREVRARHIFTCQRDPTGSRIRFGVTKLFPDIHELKVQALSASKQSGATIKKDKGEVGL